MKGRIRWRRAGALALTAAVALGGTALAADNTLTAKQRQEDLDRLYETLETRHPDLFANTPEESFLERKEEIEANLETESDVAFALDLMSVAALAGDSHTSLGNTGALMQQMRFYPMALAWWDGGWYLTAAPSGQKTLLGREVTAVNGHSMDAVVTAFGRFLSADNPVKLRREFSQGCNAAEFYEYAGLAETGAALTLTLEGGKTLSVEPVPMAEVSQKDMAYLEDQITAAPVTRKTKETYWSRALDESTYYIQYNACREDPELPMETFAAQVQKDLETGHYRRILVDLRNNGGGSDGVIWPLLEVLRQAMDGGAKAVGLIGEATFSSAVINAVELQEMGIPLVGEPTSGSVDHFGAVSGFALPNSGFRVGVSSKYIDLGTLLDADAGRGVVSLEPDIAVPQTMADSLAGKDSAVEWLLAHPERLEQKPYDSAPLTRGRFVGLLYEAAGSPEVAFENVFPDALGIEWYLDAMIWGAATGVAQGIADGSFAASRTISWQEAAVFLTRTGRGLGLEPDTVRTAPLPAALAETAWDRMALEEAWRWGWLPETADFTQGPTRAQGQAMAEALTK